MAAAVYSLTRRSQQVMRLLCGYAPARYAYGCRLNLTVTGGIGPGNRFLMTIRHFQNCGLSS
jgi:hypothetical protein